MNENEWKLRMNASIAMIIAMAIGLIVLGFTLHKTYKSKARMERELNYYHQKYLIKQGGTSLWSGSKGEWLSYELKSLDSGRNWYVIRRSGDEEFVQGNVENVYPGLMKCLKAWDALTEKAERDGPLNLGNTNDINFLRSAGFELKGIEAAVRVTN